MVQFKKRIQSYLNFYEQNKQKELIRFEKAIDKNEEFITRLGIAVDNEDVDAMRNLLISNQYSNFDISPVISHGNYGKIVVDLSEEIVRKYPKDLESIKRLEKIEDKRKKPQKAKIVKKGTRIKWSRFESNLLRNWIKQGYTPKAKIDGINVYDKFLYMEGRYKMKGRRDTSFSSKWYRIKNENKKR